MLIGAVAFGQEPLPLDPDCTVTVGNQTAFVRVDGTFFVPNIAIFQSRTTGVAPQLYRVRATCLRSGEMITGQSDFFPLTPGQTTFVADVLPTALSPIPVRINVSAPAPFLPVGATAQLAVTAILQDGSTRDVTARSAGTTYLSTNPRLLTVTEGGVVTGANTTSFPQTGTIAVLNEGNLATIDFTAVGASNDFDNDGMPNDYEDLFGLNKFANDANGDLDGDGLRNIVEFNRGTLPNNRDTDMDGIPDGVDGNPLHPEEAPPTVIIAAPVNGATLFEGETITFNVSASDDGLLTGIQLLVNGVPFGSAAASSAQLTFTVPYDASSLDFTAEARDSVGNVGTAEASILVTPDPLTTVQGEVVDTDQNPVAGANVALRLQGLKGEFFDFTTSLAALPDLTGLTPGATKLVSALNLRNPDNLLSGDTFGVGFSPDFAARFTGSIRIPRAGTYTFVLGADDGARLTINGNPVVEVPASGDFAEATGTVGLFAGTLPIRIDYFQSVGDAELQLSVIGPGGGPESVVTLSDLLQSPDPFTAIADPSGLFSVPGVPTILGNVQARAEATVHGEPASGTSAAVPPVPDGATDLGTVVVSTARFETELGTNLFQADDDFDRVQFSGGFVFPFFGVNRTQVFVNSNGNLTFGGGDGTFSPSIPGGVVSGLARISPLFVDLLPPAPRPGGGVFVNQFPDRVVVTWNRLPLFREGGDNTAQVILFADGRIQFGYNGVTADGFGFGSGGDTLDISVAVSPGGTPPVRSVDYSTDTPFTSAAGEAIFENFNTEGSFDLDGGFLVFRPNAAGGYDVSFIQP